MHTPKTIAALTTAALAITAAACTPNSTKNNPPAGQPTHTTTTAPAHAAAQSVSLSCTGKAPDGIDITYGPEGSNLGASSLPLDKTVPLDTHAQYYVVTAQLKGSGTVTCTTTVHYNDASGNAQTATKTGSATGGYNIASAQVCASFDGSWAAC